MICKPFMTAACNNTAMDNYTIGPFYQHTSTLIPAWISNYFHHKIWDETTYPFPNFNRATVEVCEWISDFIPHFTGIWLFSIPGLKLNHVSNRGRMPSTDDTVPCLKSMHVLCTSIHNAPLGWAAAGLLDPRVRDSCSVDVQCAPGLGPWVRQATGTVGWQYQVLR